MFDSVHPKFLAVFLYKCRLCIFILGTMESISNVESTKTFSLIDS